MKKLLVKILCMLIPIRSLRKKLRNKLLNRIIEIEELLSCRQVIDEKKFENIEFSKHVGNLITLKSFWFSGGSAVNDLLLEFDNISGIKQQEITLFETIDGLMDLEYRYTYNRTNIPKGLQVSKFKRLIEYLSVFGQYSHPYDSEFFFDGYFLYRSNKFIKEIVLEEKEASLEMEWHLKFKDENFIQEYKKEPFKKYNKAVKLAEKNPKKYKSKLHPISHYFPREKYYIPAGEECFEKAVIDYVNDLFSFLLNRNHAKGKHLVLDQMLNIDSYNKYKNRIKNLKYIIVDRDPRDVFILNREKLKSLVVPKNAEDFVIWFKSMRTGLNSELKKEMLYVKFEDLIYNYDKEVARIVKYLGLNEQNHVRKKEEFNPEISIKNTQTFLAKDIKDKYKNEIKIIEKRLPEYLYDFPYKKTENLKDIF